MNNIKIEWKREGKRSKNSKNERYREIGRLTEGREKRESEREKITQNEKEKKRPLRYYMSKK